MLLVEIFNIAPSVQRKIPVMFAIIILPMAIMENALNVEKKMAGCLPVMEGANVKTMSIL